MPIDRVVVPLSERWLSSCSQFSCDDEDLDSFLVDDAIRLKQEHVARTFLSVTRATGAVLGYVTILNDAVNLLTRERKKLGLPADIAHLEGVVVRSGRALEADALRLRLFPADQFPRCTHRSERSLPGFRSDLKLFPRPIRKRPDANQSGRLRAGSWSQSSSTNSG